MDVTTTSTKIGKFDARFFHLIFEKEFAKVSNGINARLILGSFKISSGMLRPIKIEK